ncbi:MAG: EAL domain-containing protein [Pseudomonadales bacterium]|nr:EAL domain-containing protein [Pseudomonadales bacterium]
MNQAPSSFVFAARTLSLSQWQVWVVVAFVISCAYFSLNLYLTQMQQRDVDALLQKTSALHETVLEGSSEAAWLISAAQLFPQLRHHVPPASEELRRPLEELTRRISAGEMISATNRIEVSRDLGGVVSELAALDASLQRQAGYATHYYYFSLLALILLCAGFVYWRHSLRARSPLNLLLEDQFLFTNIPVAVSLSDSNDRLLRANEAFEKATGFSGRELLGEQAVCDDSLEEQAAVERMRAQLDEKGCWTGEYRMRCKDGSAHAEKVMRIGLTDAAANVQGYLTLSMEAAHSDAEQRLMLWQAHHDNLTKLPNANLLHDRLGRALQEGKRGALISVDLDNFKNVNDSLGHAGADRILIEAAHRIALCARESDTVARTGGDLFIIAATDINDIAEAERLARNVVETFTAPFAAEEGELFITSSCGVTIFPDDGATAGELLQKADAARLDAKARGGNQLKFFEEQMNVVAARRFELESNLRKAIAGQEFELHFQPVVDISKQEIYGAEALLRWRSPVLGMTSPFEFIPVAEATGLIVDIGRWVVAEVQRHLKIWQTTIPDLRVSLNVSARQLVDEGDVNELLAALALECSDQITVELTESALVQNEGNALQFLAGLRDINVHLALDDFGTGYSSVGYLRDYEFDVLKVDKSFIDGIDNARDLGLVASIVAMGRILGMKVVAEGVEEADQLERLKRIGCDYVQGYYYSKPLPADEFEAFVQAFKNPQPEIQSASTKTVADAS